MERYSSSEMAQLLGVSQQAVRKRLRNITRYPRKAKGGGWEYELEVLPSDIQRKILEQARQEDSSAQAETIVEPPEPLENCPPASAPVVLSPLSPQKEEPESNSVLGKVGAIASILDLLEAYCQENSLQKCNCRQRFADAYNQGQIPVEDWIKRQIKTISPRSLLRWEKSDLGDLVPKYGKRRGKSKIDANPVLVERIEALVAQRWAGYQIMEALILEFGIENVRFSIPTLQRWIANYKEKHPQLEAIFANPNKARGFHGSKIGSTASDYPNQEWQLDSTLADIECNGRRYALVAGIDNYSRRARVYVSTTSNGEAITCLLARMIKDFGIPEGIRIDNGKDYLSERVKVAIAAFQTQRIRCLPRNPKQKPRIENFFGLLCTDLLSRLPGFVGRNVGQRKDIQARQEFEKSLVRVQLTPGELQDLLDRWCIWYESQHIHGELGMLPIAKWQEGVQIKAPMNLEDERDLDILLAPAPRSKFGLGMRKVEGGVIRVNDEDYISSKLIAWSGQLVHVRYSTIDPATIAIFEDDSLQKFICVAQCKQLMSKADLKREARAGNQEYRKIEGTARQIMRKGDEGPSMQEIQAARDNSKVIPLFGKRTQTSHQVLSTPAATEARKSIEETVRNCGQAADGGTVDAAGGGVKREKSILRGDSDFQRLWDQVMAEEVLDPKDVAWMRRYIDLPEGFALLSFLDLTREQVQKRLDALHQLAQ